MSQSESEPPGSEDEPLGPEPPTPDVDPRRRNPRAIAAALIVIALMILATVWLACGDRSRIADEVATERVDDTLPNSDDPIAIAPVVLRGRLMRELPLSESELATAPPKIAAQPTDDPELDRILAELAPWKLEPPVPGSCRVRAWQGNENIGPEVRCADDGSYELLLVPGTTGPIAVELSIDGHLRGLIEAEVGAAGEDLSLATVALGPGHRVAGQTVDARGEPLADVRVQALPQPNMGETVPWRTVSDAEGRFEFTTLPFGPVSLRGIKPGFALSVVEAIAPEDAVLMVLDGLIDLEGEVFGDPELLARARVRLEGSSVWPAIEQPLDAAGKFVFERLPDGVYGVEVTVVAAEPGGPEYASIPLENITPDLHIAVALVPAHRVPVRVVDPDGEPVLGARVTLGYSQIGMLQKIAETDEDGRVRVGPVVPGPYFVHADADGYLPPEPLELEVGPTGPTGDPGDELVLILIRPAKLEGVVVDEDDRPVAGAEVWLDSEVAFSIGEEASRRQLFSVAIGATEGSLGVTRGVVPDIPLFGDESDGTQELAGAVLTDEFGHFEIDLLLPGTHRLWATHGGHAASAVESFELRSGELRGGLRLRLREGVPLTGVVRSGNGQPIAGVQVDLGDGLVLTTDDRGVFDAGHRRGRQTLILRGQGLIAKQVEVDLGDGTGRPIDLDVELEPALGRFEGRVVDGNNQPIANVEVELRPLDGLTPTQLTWTDERGLYEFDELAPGPVELGFEHGNYVADEDRVRVSEEAGLRHEITLDTGWSINVVVRSAAGGDPIAGAELRAGTTLGQARTDKQGLGRLDRLVGDTVELEVTGLGWVPKTTKIRRDPSGLVDVTVELVEGGSLHGTVDDDIGDPVANATIEIRSPSGTVLGEVRSDGRGEWEIAGIPAGEVVVHAEPPAALSAVLEPVEIESDVIRGEVTRDVRLRFGRF